MIAQELKYFESDEAAQLLASADGIGRSLNSLINSLGKKQPDAIGQRQATND
jgi:hypothetical protein